MTSCSENQRVPEASAASLSTTTRLQRCAAGEPTRAKSGFCWARPGAIPISSSLARMAYLFTPTPCRTGSRGMLGRKVYLASDSMTFDTLRPVSSCRQVWQRKSSASVRACNGRVHSRRLLSRCSGTAGGCCASRRSSTYERRANRVQRLCVGGISKSLDLVVGYLGSCGRRCAVPRDARDVERVDGDNKPA